MNAAQHFMLQKKAMQKKKEKSAIDTFRNWRDDQGLHPAARVVVLLFRKSRIHNIPAIDLKSGHV